MCKHQELVRKQLIVSTNWHQQTVFDIEDLELKLAEAQAYKAQLEDHIEDLRQQLKGGDNA